MKVKVRRLLSVEAATGRLDLLARRNSIVKPHYDESEADSMTEFDALEWICLCEQRKALMERGEDLG